MLCHTHSTHSGLWYRPHGCNVRHSLRSPCIHNTNNVRINPEQDARCVQQQHYGKEAARTKVGLNSAKCRRLCSSLAPITERWQLRTCLN